RRRGELPQVGQEALQLAPNLKEVGERIPTLEGAVGDGLQRRANRFCLRGDLGQRRIARRGGRVAERRQPVMEQVRIGGRLAQGSEKRDQRLLDRQRQVVVHGGVSGYRKRYRLTRGFGRGIGSG